MPPPTEAEREQERKILLQLEDLRLLWQRRNLEAAVGLATEALAGHGPLVEHFAELGRRFGHDFRSRKATTQAARARRFAVIEGGAA